MLYLSHKVFSHNHHSPERGPHRVWGLAGEEITKGENMRLWCTVLVKLVLASPLLVITGCAGFSGGVGPSGVSLGSFAGNVTYPSLLAQRTDFVLDTDDFTVIGPVSAQTSSMNVLGIVGAGSSGYGELLKAARAKGADDVMNIKLDTQRMSILSIYTRSTTILTGTAIRWKRH
jgi:hypothetical protein